MSIILLLFMLEVNFIIHEVAMFVQNGSPRLRQLWRYGGRARGAAQDQQSVAQPVHLRQHQEKLGTDLRGTLKQSSMQQQLQQHPSGEAAAVLMRLTWVHSKSFRGPCGSRRAM